MIGIICAMKPEADYLISILKNKKEHKISGIVFNEGKIGEKDVVLAVCGVGKVFAAICTEAMILKYNPDIIVNTGVGGSLAKDIRLTDVVAASALVQHDMDTSPIGDEIGLISGINKVYLEVDENILKLVQKSMEEAGVEYKTGIIATGDQFVANMDKKEYIKENFNASVCEMEGGSIAHVCYVNNIKFCVMRAISDNFDDTGKEAEMNYTQFLAKAAQKTAKVVEHFIKNY